MHPEISKLAASHAIGKLNRASPLVTVAAALGAVPHTPTSYVKARTVKTVKAGFFVCNAVDSVC